MSRLSDVIAGVVELTRDEKGRIDIGVAVSKASDLLDDDDRDSLIREALGNRIKNFTTRQRKTALSANPKHPTLFPELHESHAIDVEGRYVKLTDEMSEIEFKRVMTIRSTQIENDTKYFQALERAYKAVQPFWKRSPGATFGDVCKLLANESGRSA